MADLDRLDIAAGLDLTGLDADFRTFVSKVDSFASVLQKASQGLPPIEITATSSKADQTLAEARAKFERVIKETADLARFPDFSTADARREVHELVAEYSGLDAALKKIDPSGILRITAEQSRGADAAFEAVLAKRQQAEAPLKLSVDTTGLTAQMDGAVLAVKGSTEQIHALLQQTFLDEAQVRQAVPGAAVPSVVTAQQNPEAARLAQAVAAEAATTARAAEAMDRLTAADVQQALAAAQAGAASVEAARQIEAQGRAAIVAAEQVAQAQRLAAAGVAPTIPSITPPSGLRELIAQEEALKLATRGIPEEVSRTVAPFNEAGRQANVLSREIRGVVAGNEKMAAGIDLASGTVNRGSAAFEGHTRGVGRAVNALTALTATSIGAEGPLARLAETALLFSGGELAVVAVAGGVLGLATAYNFLTSAQRAEREEQEKLVQGLLTEAQTAVPAAIQAQNALTAALQHQRDVREGLSAGQVLKTEGEIVLAVANPQQAIAGILRERQLKQEADATTAVEQAQRRLNAAQQAAQESNVGTLAESIRLHVADAAEIERARVAVIALQAEEKNGLLTPQERNRLIRERITLEEALRDTAVQDAKRGAATQGIQDQLGLDQQGFQLQQQQLQAQFAQELVTRDQFFARRRELLVQAAKADEAALRQQATTAGIAAAEAPADKPEVRIAQQALEQHLLKQIDLRGRVLEQQLDQIKNEQKLAELAELQVRLAQQHLLRVQEAGGGNQLGGAPPRQELPTVAPGAVPAAPPVPLILQGAATREVDGLTASFNKAAVAEKQVEANALAVEQVLAEIGLRLKDVGNANISAPEDLAAAVHDVTRGLGEVATGAQNIGLIGQEAASAIGDVLHLGDAIGDVVKKASAGNIAGLIGAGLSAVSSVGHLLGIGKSQTDRDLEEAMKQNSRALADATRAYQATQGRFQGGGGIAQQQVIVERVLASPAAQAALQEKDLNAFRTAVEATGISLDELRNIAHDQGITLVKDHHLVQGGAEALDRALRIAADAAGTLGNTISDQQRTAETRDKLGLPDQTTGITRSTDPQVARLERVRDLELNNLNLSAAEEAKIRALDLSTAQGRKAFLEEQRSLEQRIESGAFKGTAGSAALGGFNDVTELQNALNEAADGLSAFGNAVDAATRKLSNVPDLLTLSEQEFRARSAFGPTAGGSDGSQLPIIGHPTPLDRPGIEIPAPGISESRVSLDGAKVTDPITAALGKVGGGASLKDLLDALTGTRTTPAQPTSASGRVVNVYGEVKVNVQGVPNDPAATARAVKAEFLAELGREDL